MAGNCDNIRSIESLLEEWLCNQLGTSGSGDPQVESANLIKYCDANGDVQAFATVLVNEVDNSTTKLFFDSNLDPIGALPAGLSVCSESKDIETISDCYMSTADNSIRYTGTSLIDTSVSPVVSVGTLWQDSTGAFIATPTGIELCNETPVQVDQSHVEVSGTGNIPAGLKTVTISNLSGITVINGGFELGNGRRPLTISYNATELSEVRGLLPAFNLSGGTFQWTGLQPINEQ